MTKLLLDEHPLFVLPTLACALGLNEAIVLQQLHYWLRRSEHKHKGRKWVYNAYNKWHLQFPFWSESTIRRALGSLRTQGVVLVDRFNKKPYDKTNWYSIDYDRLSKMTSGLCQEDWSKWTDRSAQNEQMDEVNLTRPIPETTTETTTETPEDRRLSSGTAFACPECGQICKSKRGLSIHRRIHGKDTRHPALAAYQDASNYCPVKSVRGEIEKAVGEDPQDVAFWGDVVKYYVGLGWNPRNVRGMLKFYRRRELPKVKGKGRSQPQGEKEPRRYIEGRYAEYIEH